MTSAVNTDERFPSKEPNLQRATELISSQLALFGE